jgi:glycosyltransferase involved in cell wall biosynthesis
MRVVIDAIGVVPFGGYAVALEAILAGWEELGTDDELHLLMAEGVDLEIPASVEIHRFSVGRPAALRRVAVQTRAAREVCRATGADALLGILPTTAVGPVGCPKVIMVYDMRHELLPEQFTRGRRMLRRVGYGLGYRQAAAIICISERTRGDLLRSRPWLARKPVVAVLWAADHVDRWPRRDPAEGGEPYALAFGHFPNKAVDRVIDTWEVLRGRGEARPLVFVGLPRSAREGVVERIRGAGLEDLVTPMPWLEREEFEACFASAGLIVFPSDFEGFGLPAVEAMRLGIPLVISTDEALLEVTGGHATIVEGTDPESLAAAVTSAWATPPEELERAREFVGHYSWAKTARETREVLASAAAGRAARA